MERNATPALGDVGPPGVPPRRKVLGLTGNPGSGKSTVAAWMREMGAVVVSGDAEGHRLLRRDSPVYQTLVDEYDVSILGPKNRIDRKALSRVVTKTVEELRRYSRLIHPVLIETISYRIEQFRKSRKTGPLVVDAALIYEWGMSGAFDAVLVVAAPRAERQRRFLAKCKNESLFQVLESAQWPEQEKVQRADVVFQNEGDLAELRSQVEAFMNC